MPTAFLFHHRGDTIPGVVLPSGRAVLIEDEDFGAATVAPTADDLLTSYPGAHIQWPDLPTPKEPRRMTQRLKARTVDDVLGADGHSSSEFDGGDWDPGYRTAQAGPRIVHVFHDGPGEEQQITAYTKTLQADGYNVQHEQQDHGGRHRLTVTRP
ncbi:hypothetical protein P3L51_24545 [Streptomyces sp. PSRA5]|uniref:hypothetical protein n=1 Tax=Streptomyces panacea TaxID=3035064 RepID=UPI00339D0CA8